MILIITSHDIDMTVILTGGEGRGREGAGYADYRSLSVTAD